MKMFLYILVPVLFFSILDLRSAIRDRKMGYVTLYLGMVTCVMVCVVLLSRGIVLPSPNRFIIAAIEVFTGPLG